ncbi:MAG: hypothetical protein SGI72_16335 [Planctomycetota bacterium]|nr:hypothetical protein [Planctomycetota bacterium]
MFNKLVICFLTALAVLLAPTSTHLDAQSCPTGVDEVSTPCNWSGYVWEYWASGGSGGDCSGCEVDWTWTITQLNPEKQTLIGNSHDKINCDSSGASHTIPCPNGGGGGITFNSSCGTCQ